MDDEGLQYALVAEGRTLTDFVEAVNNNTVRVVEFPGLFLYNKNATPLSRLKDMFEEELCDRYGEEFSFNKGFTIEILEKILEDWCFIDGDSRSKIQMLTF